MGEKESEILETKEVKKDGLSIPRWVFEKLGIKPLTKLSLIRVKNFLVLEPVGKETKRELEEISARALRGVKYREIKEERGKEEGKREEKLERWWKGKHR